MSKFSSASVPANLRFFSKPNPDMRRRQSLVDFLTGHFRYDTMNSCNQSTAYANRVKIPYLGLTSDQEDQAYELLQAEDGMDFVEERISAFTREHHGAYTAAFNGRQGGYLVMYQSFYKQSEHKSRCTCCGQLNFQAVHDISALSAEEQAIARKVCGNRGCWFPQTYLKESELLALALPDAEKLAFVQKWTALAKTGSPDNTCGRCHAKARVPYSAKILSVYPGKGIDHCEDFEGWSMGDLRNRVLLVQSFDALCDRIREDLIDVISACEVVEKTVMVPTKVRVLQPRAEAV